MNTTHSPYLAAAGVSLLLLACQVPSGPQGAASGPRVVKFQLRPDPLAN